MKKQEIVMNELTVRYKLSKMQEGNTKGFAGVANPKKRAYVKKNASNHYSLFQAVTGAEIFRGDNESTAGMICALGWVFVR